MPKGNELSGELEKGGGGGGGEMGVGVGGGESGKGETRKNAKRKVRSTQGVVKSS